MSPQFFLAAALIAGASAAVAQQAAVPVQHAPTHLERGNLVFEGIPPPDAALNARLDAYLQSREATFLDWLPDGRMLIATRFGDSTQVHRVAAPLGAREQLTFYRDPISWVRAASTGGSFAFLKDQEGDENYQVYVEAPNATVRQLTSGNFIHGSPVWAHDGKRIAFYGSDRDGASYDVYVADVSAGAGAPQLVVGGRNDTWYPLGWSPDDSKLLVWRYESLEESYLYIADVASGTLTPVDPSARKIGIRLARFAPDGRGVYFVSDEGGEFNTLTYTDLATHTSHRVSAQSGWDVEDFDVSADGRYIAYVLNEDGISRLTVLDTQLRRDLAPIGLPQGRIANLHFDASGKKLGMSAESAQSPRDAYVYEPESGKLERWTKSEMGPLGAANPVAPELIRYPTWDRSGGHPRMLAAYVYRPSTAPCPVLIYIHGGPEDQYRPAWDPFVQFLVRELGYAVVAPNVRGSSGYGKSFLALDNGVLREDAVRDIGSLLVWIGAQPAFDRAHVAVMGASYGGYMTLASLVSYGERLSGGVDAMGISNFVTFLRNTAVYRRDLRREEYGDERDPSMRLFLERISPLTNAGRIKKPVLVVQGLNDARVPASESEQLVWRVRAAGGEVWYLVAKDEGHGFRNKANHDAYLQTAASFLNKLAK